MDTTARLSELSEEGEMGSVQRRNYPEAFKREAVERVGSSAIIWPCNSSSLSVNSINSEGNFGQPWL